MTAGIAPDLLASLADPASSLAKVMQAVSGAESAGDFARQVSVGISSNATVDLLGLFLRRHALMHGVRLAVHQGNYDDPIGDVERFLADGVDHIVMLPVFDNLLPCFEAQIAHLAPEAIAAKEAEMRSRLRLAFDKARPVARVFLGTFHRLTPACAPAAADPVTLCLQRFNDALRAEASAFPNVQLIDMGEVAGSVGPARAVDWRFYLRNKAPYAAPFLDALARRVALASRGFGSYFYKAVVLDCDNTLWGGVIGEDLLDGIKIGRFDYPGNVFWRVQNQLLALERQGVLLCLCSKNNPADVDEALRRHPEMVLRDRDFAIKKVNWRDKADNLRDIAAELNIGLDALVFLDDSSFECEAVRSRLPAVRTFQVPTSLIDYPALLDRIGELLLAGGVAADSRSKTEHYRQRAASEAERSGFASQEDYLASLDLTVEVATDARRSIARISELTQKSNQFNLTSRRYGEGEIGAAMDDPDAMVVSLAVRDKFGEAGLTGVAVIRIQGSLAEVENFLMSCRVIGRGIEFAVWPAIMRNLAARGCDRVTAEYRPTAKNAQVADFYDRLGFSLDEQSEAGSRRYSCRPAAFRPPATPWIKVLSC